MKICRCQFPQDQGYRDTLFDGECSCGGKIVPRHNHITRDIKPYGECPVCDDHHRKHAEKEFNEKMKDAKITFSTKCRDCGLDYHSLPSDVVHVCGEGNFKVKV